MALLGMHQLKFNIHKDAKSLMEAIEKRFGGNKETKKVQKTLLKQQYENFSGSSSESLDQIHDRLQKLIGQLEILGESLHLDKFLHVTQSIKVNGVTDDAFRLYLFPYSLTHYDTAWFDRLLRNSINTFEQMTKMFLGKYFPPSMVTKLRNEITNFRQRPDESLFKAWERYKISIDRCPNHNMLPVAQIDTFYNGLTLRHRDTINAAAGASHGQNPPPAYQALAYQASGYQASVHQPVILQPQVVTTTEFTNYMKANDAILKNMQTNMTSLTNSSLELKNMFGQFLKMNTASSLGSGTLLSNTVTNPKKDLKVEHKTEVTKDTVPHTNNESTKDVQPLIVQIETPVPNIEPVVALVVKPSLLNNKDKLFELAKTPLNEHCSAVLLKKLPQKLRDPDKFLIPCDLLGMDEFLALADLSANINLMPLSMWNKLSLPELTPTLMTLKLAHRLISRPIGIAEDVFVKVGRFHFLADFVVVDFDADPRVPLILRRSFLKTQRALINFYAGELTLRVNNEAVTFNLDQTSRYSANYNDVTANRIDVIDMACKEYSKEVLGFSDVIASGNSTPYYDPIVSTSSPTLTLFGDCDFLLEEVDAFLALEDW
uniref:Reverse transcriptase domain-containing protein n=1 Tax=Tanacetum cinerariifolium TaxID=118510 RepID=A0A6L2KAZ6_TANCI|nr:reverse transcriptase domain-containing protein [Tanacetum cinerariifolium]